MKRTIEATIKIHVFLSTDSVEPGTDKWDNAVSQIERQVSDRVLQLNLTHINHGGVSISGIEEVAIECDLLNGEHDEDCPVCGTLIEVREDFTVYCPKCDTGEQ